jgi:transposase
MEEFAEKTRGISEIYINATEWEARGVHVYSTDEKMGIYAREHKNPSIPMKEGQVERIDPEYIRHGTSGIIASRNIATGEIAAPLVQPTRTEEDYARHIKKVFELNPEDKHIFVNDNLNTHKSEALVRLVAEIDGISASELGKKGRSGILKSLESREMFLSNPEHKIQFVYTPKHCSWLNQIECWFGIITRRLLNRRASFFSVADLEQKIISFIEYYNKYLKKPFQWNYKGKMLMA